MSARCNLGQGIDQLLSVVDHWKAPGHSVEITFPNNAWRVQFTWNVPNYGLIKRQIVDLTNHTNLSQWDTDSVLSQGGLYRDRVAFHIALPEALFQKNRDKLLALRDKIDSKAEQFLSADKKLIQIRDRHCKAAFALITIFFIALYILKQSNRLA